MYFRNFSETTKSIGGYVLSTRKFVQDMPISGICKREYLYGDDLQIEKWFSRLGIWICYTAAVTLNSSIGTRPAMRSLGSKWSAQHNNPPL